MRYRPSYNAPSAWMLRSKRFSWTLRKTTEWTLGRLRALGWSLRALGRSLRSGLRLRFVI